MGGDKVQDLEPVLDRFYALLDAAVLLSIGHDLSFAQRFLGL
jgi:hypothetical protein